MDISVWLTEYLSGVIHVRKTLVDSENVKNPARLPERETFVCSQLETIAIEVLFYNQMDTTNPKFKLRK